MTKKRIRITDGGIALPLGNNTFLMRGRLHSQGGIGIGNGGKNDIEVEDGEVIKFNKDNIQVLSDQPMLNGISPANALLAGGNFNKIFKAQQSINGNYGGSYGKDGLIKKLIGFFTGNTEKENTNKENKKDAPIDWDEIKIKQAYTESGFDSKAVSKAPAYGLYQITPQTLKEFNDKTGNTYTVEDLYNDKINTEIRDWYMNDLYNREWNTKNNPSDSVRATKTIMAYNMGPTNLVNRLNELKAKGYDIYQSLDWTQDDSIPVESREYNDFILRNINNSTSRNQLAYETSRKKNSNKVEGIRNGFKNGGRITYKNGGERNIPTIEEYITQKLDSIRNNALERSRKKTQDETTIVTEADVYGKKELIRELQQEYNNALSTYNILLEDIYNKYKKDNPITSEKYTKLDFIENNKKLKYYHEHLNDAKNLLEDAKNGKYKGIELSNCIANLSEMFPHGLPYGNESFRSNPKKYGFSLIDTWDVEPGDLIQHIFNDRPHHAMIYNGIDENGNHTFNYSNGLSPSIENAGYGTNKHYPDVVAEDGKHLWDVNVYRYTGTPQDSIQWSNEYDQKYGKTLKNGGQINMKLKHRNKQDITDMVINEILPHSTGERKKFFTGGFWTNFGANALNSLIQGIVSPILNYKMADEIEKSGKDLQPVQMSKTYLDSRDYTLNNLLGDVDRTVNKFIDISSKNTNNAKTHMNRIRGLLSDATSKKQAIIGQSLNRSDNIRRENARMAQEVDKINITNKNQFALVNEQNRLARQAAAMNARMAGNAAITQSIGSLLKGVGTAFYDWDKIGLSLLNSENPKAWDLFNSHWGKNWK